MERLEGLNALPENISNNNESNPTLEQEHQWVCLAASGDRQAFNSIYHLHINRVYGLCLRLTADKVKAETLAQDVFIKAWSKLDGFSGKGSLSGWLGSLAVNQWRDQFRYRLRQEKLLNDAALSWENDRSPNGSIIPLLTKMDLEASLQKLPRGARTVFVLHEIEGYKHREIAEMLNTSTGTVKSQLHRARKLLRVLLDPDGQGHAGSQGA